MSEKKKEGAWWRKYTQRHLQPEPERGRKEMTIKEALPAQLDPFAELGDVHRMMDETFRNAFDFGRGPLGFPRMLKMDDGIFRQPRVEVKETDKEVIVTAELPGIRKEDLNLKILEQSLIIDAQTRQEKRHDAAGQHSYSSSFNGYRHVVPLPAPIDKTKSKAGYENGVLMVRLAKLHPGEGPSDIEIE